MRWKRLATAGIQQRVTVSDKKLYRSANNLSNFSMYTIVHKYEHLMQSRRKIDICIIFSRLRWKNVSLLSILRFLPQLASQSFWKIETNVIHTCIDQAYL